MKNKRGWIRIVEAFVALLLITGVVLIVVGKGSISKKDISLTVYEAESIILREIELNSDFRDDILEVDAESIPVLWESFEDEGLGEIKEKLKEKFPDYLDCRAQVCWINDLCESVLDVDKDIYAQAVLVTSNTEIYSPRQLKLFCWVR